MLPEEYAEAIDELLSCETWTDVVRPALAARAQLLQTNVMTMVPPDPLLVSRLQGEYRLLHQLLENPERVLMDEEATVEISMAQDRGRGAGNGRGARNDR